MKCSNLLTCFNSSVSLITLLAFGTGIYLYFAFDFVDVQLYSKNETSYDTTLGAKGKCFAHPGPNGTFPLRPSNLTKIWQNMTTSTIPSTTVDRSRMANSTEFPDRTTPAFYLTTPPYPTTTVYTTVQDTTTTATTTMAHTTADTSTAETTTTNAAINEVN